MYFKGFKFSFSFVGLQYSYIIIFLTVLRCRSICLFISFFFLICVCACVCPDRCVAAFQCVRRNVRNSNDPNRYLGSACGPDFTVTRDGVEGGRNRRREGRGRREGGVKVKEVKPQKGNIAGGSMTIVPYEGWRCIREKGRSAGGRHRLFAVMKRL